jgi:hypothetical protein
MIRNSPFHKINRTLEGGYEINVGQAYGITERALFVVYPSRQDVDSGSALQGYVKPSQISAFKTLLDLPVEMAAMTTQNAVVLQVRLGVERPFPIYISGKSRVILNNVVDMVRNEMEKRGMREVEVVSNHSLAKLGLDVKSDNREVVLSILDSSISQWGLSRIHHDFALPPSFNALYPVLAAAARFDWHLHRESRGIRTAQVDIEFTRLRENSKTELVPVGPNMIQSGSDHEDDGTARVVLVDVSEKAIYGIRLTNRIGLPLYVSVFYFDSSDLSISKYTFNCLLKKVNELIFFLRQHLYSILPYLHLSPQPKPFSSPTKL